MGGTMRAMHVKGLHCERGDVNIGSDSNACQCMAAHTQHSTRMHTRTPQVKGQDILDGELAASKVNKTEHVLQLKLSKPQEELYKCFLEVRAPGACGVEALMAVRVCTCWDKGGSPTRVQRREEGDVGPKGAGEGSSLACADAGHSTIDTLHRANASTEEGAQAVSLHLPMPALVRLALQAQKRHGAHALSASGSCIQPLPPSLVLAGAGAERQSAAAARP